MKIEDKHSEILKILEENARLSDKEIATLAGLKESEVKSIIEELETKGIIRKYKAIIDYEKAGIEAVQALIDIKVIPERSTGYDNIAERISKFPEVKSVRLVSGEYDLSVLVAGKTMREVAYFVAEKIAPLEQVRNTVTHFLLKTYKENGEVYGEEEEGRRLRVTL
ncbi:MAG: Lrp/AsnC family transcriptional regulator [Methanophagales archaeon]|nr:Lrp/AsnC family transcriptional regulator [Methanophagales archaeon]MCW3138769.1 Lrp/AsnC family transcriptional regulator [Methanophagales archaeon]MCW7069094.1 Lrp/AsnC family transcriptional regulator [Methanophagales archaeon]MCW7073100.1 Lrp/AsnC family transcriptional regulator [Methanophagales archaeon]